MKILPAFAMAREGIAYLLGLCIASIFGFLFFLPLGLGFLALAGFIAFFFRDPPRSSPADPDKIYSPADGTVQEITVEQNTILNGEVFVVNIFLSIWDVHINRSPLSGEVMFTKHTPGNFRPAFLKSALQANENNLIGIKNDRLTLLVRQVAGLIARRIVCYVQPRQSILQGEKIGLIQFGSAVKLYMPKIVKLQVLVGDKVRAGETAIGVF